MLRILNTPRLAVWAGRNPQRLRGAWTFRGRRGAHVAVRRERFRRTWYRLPGGLGVCVERRAK